MYQDATNCNINELKLNTGQNMARTVSSEAPFMLQKLIKTGNESLATLAIQNQYPLLIDALR